MSLCPTPSRVPAAQSRPIWATLARLLPICWLGAITASGCGTLATRWEETGQTRATVSAQSAATLEYLPDDPLLAGVEVLMKETPLRQSLARDPSWTILYSLADRTVARVSGEWHDGQTDLDPIVIRTDGGEAGGWLAAQLGAIYQARGWAYRVVSEPAARSDSESGPK